MAQPLNIYNLDKFNPYDFFIPLTFSINDFRDISTRNGTFSKTVKIPGTKKNDSLLGHSFDITAEGFYDRNKRVPAIIEKDGIRYLEGSMQLKSVEIQDGKSWVYNIILYSDLSDWSALIKDKNIRDLEYDTFTYNANNVEASWSYNGADNGYTFPLINYGNLESLTYTDNIQVEDFLPSVFVYDVFRKIFKEAGYNLKPGFFAKKQFRDLILPGIRNDVDTSNEILENNRFEGLSFYGLYTPRVIENTPTNLAFALDPPVDPGNNYANNAYNCPFIGGVYSGNASVFIKNTRSSTDVVTITIRRYQGAVYMKALDTQVVGLQPNSSSVEVNLSFEEEAIPQGDRIEVYVESSLGNTRLEIFANGLNVNPISAPLAEGDEISIKDFVYDMDQASFIKYFVQMFNLIHVTDSRAKTVEFLHRDDFYKPKEEAEDWSEKIDISKRKTIEQIDEKLKRTLLFEYSDDSNDERAQQFKDTWDTTFTDESIKLDNEFLKDEKKVADIRFSGSLGGYNIEQSSGTPLYMPQLITNFQTPSEAISINPRVLIYEGLKNGQFTFESTLKNQFPSSYFIKRTSLRNDISLSFKNLNEVSKSIQDSDQGLVERYYSDQIRQFNKARLYSCYMKLTGVDIVNLDFRKPKFINGVYYYLNKIEDYKAGVFESVKCEFIQIV